MNKSLKTVLFGILAFSFTYPSLAQQSTPPSSKNDLASIFSNNSEDELLEPEQAFQLLVTTSGPNALSAQLMPAKGYYLYKNKIKFTLKDAAGVTLGAIKLPTGETKTDQIFGMTEVHKKPIVAEIALSHATKASRVTLVASYQGCHEKLGVCYPPIEKIVTLTPP